ncbi:Beta-peptidyl aminopeptidase BapA [Cladobotryum mycophilum]|uniref:Beta-peptidyl aminopeptidase BapA n=1 Tax=Cladobotryum mycophilum TaxID=491253 RepID=A0ABR0SDH4_9HYPO
MSPQTQSPRGRVRQIIPSLPLGKWSPGPLNSLTDIPGVLVHTESIHSPSSSDTAPSYVNTGVTTILPRKDWYKFSSFAGIFRFNGCGEMTGSHWIEETGLLSSPIIVTTTNSIGDAYKGVWQYAAKHHSNEDGELTMFIFPVAAETFDGFLNDTTKFSVTPEHIVKGIENATADPVPEGNTGGGTGMICHRYKGGTGSSSRVVQGFDLEGKETSYTVGVLVQANYGSSANLHIGGIPVGRILKEQEPSPPEPQTTLPTQPRKSEPIKDGSIIIIIGTDAPYSPSSSSASPSAPPSASPSNTSGDIFLAFSTANKIPFQELSYASDSSLDPYKPVPTTVTMSDNDSIDSLFEAAADATEEAIYNALFMAETMTGMMGRTIEALDLVKAKEIVEKRL